MDPFIQALFLATANKAIVDYLSAPFKKKYPHVDYWFLVYVALVTGGLVGYIANINLFAEFIPDALTGRILTSALIGGGSGLIYNVFDKRPLSQNMFIGAQPAGDSQTNLMTAGDTDVTVNQPPSVSEVSLSNAFDDDDGDAALLAAYEKMARQEGK